MVEHFVYVAPIQDDMLLGIDLSFLQKHCQWVKLHCGIGEMQLGDSVPMLLMHKNKTGPVKAVSVRRVRLPPLSVGVIECDVLKEMHYFILKPVDNCPLGVLLARSFNKSGKSGLIIITQRSQVFKAGQEFVAASAD